MLYDNKSVKVIEGEKAVGRGSAGRHGQGAFVRHRPNLVFFGHHLISGYQ